MERTVTTIALIVFIAAVAIAALVVLGPIVGGIQLPTGLIR